MDQSIENKSNFKNKIINFYNYNKVKSHVIAFASMLFLILFIFIKNNNEKKNIYIAEKYVEAGLLLNSNKKEDAKIIYNEIIVSNNKFYSILALNTIIEKELITDKNKIEEYFNILEAIDLSKENIDLINFKKALYLINNDKLKKGNELLKNLLANNSNFKELIAEILEN